ncbi:Sec-independent protein translocase protein TatB [Paraburkholderia sp. BCC1885]|uniref:Sec-independent protein translocase protein TatB n=1 Tax=Paraburkholderia sp. BCC1885 TaxID=2562669 RepID=UPI001183C4DF|nr:Sec-independent protein translocase protein TatB [Paraburkholderia sp. BCC1885]
MLDFDVSKLAVIGVVALVVLGPERLPRVARTAGTLLGRAQRYLSSVQSEVDLQIQMDELRKLKSSIELAAADVQSTVERTVNQHAGELKAGVDAAAATLQEALPAAYLPSIHEGAGDLQADLFKVRPAHAQLAPATVASIPAQMRDEGVSFACSASAAQRARPKWRGASAVSRRGAIKRSRVVSTAASKALGRDFGRLA